jgi:hypothetical protein
LAANLTLVGLRQLARIPRVATEHQALTSASGRESQRRRLRGLGRVFDQTPHSRLANELPGSSGWSSPVVKHRIFPAGTSEIMLLGRSLMLRARLRSHPLCAGPS